MPVKWKKNKNLKPGIILQKIDSIKTVKADNSVSYSGFEYYETLAIIQNMIEFPLNMRNLHQESIVSTAINNVAREKVLDAKSVINEINNVVKNELARREYKYHLLTTISLKSPYPSKNIIIEDCRIRLFETPYPAKYKGRNELINGNRKVIDGTPHSYAKVIVSLKSKSERSAASKALRVLDIQRAIWCLFGNSTMEVWGDEWLPINKIHLGSAHTIHKENGKLAIETFWYEPNFVKVNAFIPKKIKIFKDNSKWALAQLNNSSYSTELKNSLLRYVRALDEKDQNVALIKLWGAIETLAAPSEANYDLITRRCSFLFTNRNYHKQVLEHLREYRNISIHAGDQSERVKSNCYQLQFYYYHLVMFHLKNADQFKSLEEANNFLDLPSDISTLKNRKRLIDKAIKFRT